MSTREHQRIGIMHEGVTRSGYRLTCSTTDCAATEAINCPKPGGFPHESVTHKFSQKGWTVGRSPNHDLCPACTRAKMLRKPVAVEKPNVVPIAPAFAAMAESPRQMERADRRIIISKLEEVYVDESHGYDAGWTDKRVADDLGVPLAWVRDLRDENFGPEGLSDADRAALAAADAFQAGLAELTKKANHIADLQEKLAAEIDDLKGKFGPVARDVKEIHKATVRA